MFGRSVTEKTENQTMLSFFRRHHTGALCTQHSPTAVALSTSFLPNHAPNSPEMNALITRFRDSYSSVSMSHKSKELKKSSSDWLNSGNALIQHLSEKCNFRVSPFCPVVQKHKLLEGGTVKRRLIAYFIGNISAKKILQSIHVCQSYSKPKVGRVLIHGVHADGDSDLSSPS